MKILVTGGAGSLGRAFVRYLSPTNEVIVLDKNEWAVAEFASIFPNVEVRLTDFATYDFHDAPDVLIHLAAYKHVNLGECNPASFVENNVTKTGELFRKAKEMAVDVLFISTDKAVEPISTYGFTKALGERLCLHYGGQVARLGNILNSSGSVIPAWEAAIRDKRPLKVTNPAMQRYLIDENDAVKQIWAGFQDGKKLIIPDMGDPVTVAELLSKVLAKHGYKRRDDYEPGFEIIGIRPGEKLAESLYWSWENQQQEREPIKNGVNRA